MKKYLYTFLILLFFCQSIFADTNISSIGITDTCDGDCTYTTIQGWETAVEGDLVTAGDIEKGECWDDGDFDEVVDINGSTTDSSNYMWLTSASGERHDGTHLNGVVNSRGTNTGVVFTLTDNFTLFEDMIVLDGGAGASEHIIIGGDNCTLRNIISHTAPDHAIQNNGTAADTVLINCIVIDSDDDAIHCRGGGSMSAYNSLTYNTTGGRGFNAESTATIVATNCISMVSSLIDYGGAGTVTQSYNISSDDTASGTGSVIDAVATTDDSPAAGIWVMFENISAGTEDFHLKPAVSEVNEAEGAGTDVSGTTGYSLDIDLETRIAQDIGPDEITPAAGVTFIPRIQMF